MPTVLPIAVELSVYCRVFEYLKIHVFFFYFYSRRSQRRQSTRRGVRGRPTVTGLDETENRRTSPLRSQALRHIENPTSIQRLRVENLGKVRAILCRSVAHESALRERATRIILF